MKNNSKEISIKNTMGIRDIYKEAETLNQEIDDLGNALSKKYLEQQKISDIAVVVMEDFKNQVNKILEKEVFGKNCKLVFSFVDPETKDDKLSIAVYANVSDEDGKETSQLILYYTDDEKGKSEYHNVHESFVSVVGVSEVEFVDMVKTIIDEYVVEGASNEDEKR